MVVVTAGVFLCGLMVTYGGIVASLFGMVELKKRKNKKDNDDDSGAPATAPQSSNAAVSDDEGEEELESKSKRKKEDMVTKTKKIPTEGPVSHTCRFCLEVFTQAQALGGHMNRHRRERELEEVQRAQELLTRRQPFNVSNSWNMPSSLQNSQLNQQNLRIATQPSQGDNYTYNSADNSRSQCHVSPSTWTTSLIGQLQAQRGLGVNSGQQHPSIQTFYSNSSPMLYGGRHFVQPQDGSQSHGNQGGLQDPNIASSSQHGQSNLPIAASLRYPPGGQQQHLAIQTIYSNSNPVLHSGRHIAQPQYGSQSHSYQGGLQDPNIASSSQQGQTNLPIAPFLRYPPGGVQIVQFVDQHGNRGPVPGGGHNSQMLQGYNQSPLDQRPNIGGLIGSASSGVGSEHIQLGQGVVGMPSLDAGQELGGVTDDGEDTAFMEAVGFDTDLSVHDYM